MIGLGLPDGQMEALVDTLRRPHVVGARVEVLDLEHNPKGDLTGSTIGGQLNIDVTKDITRQLDLTILDPKGAAALQTEFGQPRLDRMIRCYYSVYVRDPLWTWIDIPVFTGPITDVSRTGHSVAITAQGKESLALGPCWRPRVWQKGLTRTGVMRSMLTELAGETHFSFPPAWKARTAKRLSLTNESAAWPSATSIAKSMSAQLFYNGMGVARLRRRPVRSVFTFRDGDGGMLTSLPKVTETSKDLTNTWRVTGAIPAGKSKPLRKTVFLPPEHPHSPISLGRLTKPQYHAQEIDDDTLRSQKDVDEAAERAARVGETDTRMVEFTSLAFPLLEEDDLFAIDADGVNMTSRVKKISLPIGHAGQMTVGYLAPVSRRRW